MAIFYNWSPLGNVCKGDFMAIGDVADNTQDLAAAGGVPNLHLGSVRNAFRKNGGNIVGRIHLQCQMKRCQFTCLLLFPVLPERIRRLG